MDAKKATKSETNANGGYILGLDLGVTSVGWAKIPIDSSQISDETLDMGVRIFEMAVEAQDGKSKNLARRQARQVRKGYRRTRRRMTKLFNRLRNGGLLPDWDASTPEKRQAYLNKLDAKLFNEYFCDAPRDKSARRVVKQTFLYKLRARALDEKLEPDAVGRILLLLASRRGYRSNKILDGAKRETPEQDLAEGYVESADSKKATKRKTESAKTSTASENAEKSRDEDGLVTADIKKLDREMRDKKARTLGELWADVDPECERIRTRHPSREQIRDEFNKIWNAQAPFHREKMTPKLYRLVERAIFAQRPLKSQRKRVGFCPLEWNPELKRGPRCVAKGDPAFQEYRIWQRVLDLRLYDSPEAPETARSLTPEEQDKVAAFLGENESATFNQLRKTLGIKGSPIKTTKRRRFGGSISKSTGKANYSGIEREQKSSRF